MNWIDTNTLITICTCAIGLTQFILWKHIAKVKAYEAEKGKNLATKEDTRDISYEQEKGKNLATKDDIEKITKKIESVKNEISFYKQREDEFLKERKKAYLNFINCADCFQLYKVRINVAFNTIDNSSYAHTLLDNLTEDYMGFENAYRNILIYYTEKITMENVDECYNKINNYASLFYLTLINSIPYIDRQAYIIGNPKYSSEFSENQREIKKRYDEYRKKVDEYEKKYIEGCDNYTILLSVLFELDFHQKKIYYSEKKSKPTTTNHHN